MATANDITALKARVEALGYRLVTTPLDDRHGQPYTGLYVLDDETHELQIVSAGSAKDDLAEVTAWCERQEEAEGSVRRAADLLAAEGQRLRVEREATADARDMTAEREDKLNELRIMLHGIAAVVKAIDETADAASNANALAPVVYRDVSRAVSILDELAP